MADFDEMLQNPHPTGRIERDHAYPPAAADNGADGALLEKLDTLISLVQNVAGRVEALETRRDSARRDNVETPPPAPVTPRPAAPVVDSRNDEALLHAVRMGDPMAIEARKRQLESRIAEIEGRNRQRQAAEETRRLRVQTQVPLSEREERELVAIQARCDSAFQNIGLRAPAPALYERPQIYRRRILGRLQRYSTDADLRGANLGFVPDDILDRLEPAILAGASRADAVAVDLQDGEERCIERPNMDGTRTREFYRKGGTFIRDFKAENRRVVIRDPMEIRTIRALSKAGL